MGWWDSCFKQIFEGVWNKKVFRFCLCVCCVSRKKASPGTWAHIKSIGRIGKMYCVCISTQVHCEIMLGADLSQPPDFLCRVGVWPMNGIFIFGGAQGKGLHGTSQHSGWEQDSQEDHPGRSEGDAPPRPPVLFLLKQCFWIGLCPRMSCLWLP